MHLSPLSPSVLPSILKTPRGLKITAAMDGQPIQAGHVYVAQPDLHLLIEPGYVRLSRGPRENRHRPAIDPMFRSASRAYGPRLLAIFLTGLLDDGAQGLHIVKSAGGITMVQDPDEAMFNDMPRNAIKVAEIDYVLKVAEMPQKIMEFVREPWTEVDPSRA